MRTVRRLLLLFGASVFCFFAAASAVLAQVPGPGDPAPVPDGPAITALPVGIIVVSFVMTGVGYLLNYALPFLKTDEAKGVAHAVYQAAGVTLFELATGSNFGLNKETGTAFLIAMATWAFSHGLIYKPTGWAYSLKAGQNSSE